MVKTIWITTITVALGFWVTASAQDLESLVSPGALSSSHQQIVGISACDSCHTPGQGSDDQKCLRCHSQLALRVSEERGFHQDKPEACAVCHPEHQGEEFDIRPLDEEDFDHSETGYLLEGLHGQVGDCRDCHKPDSFPETGTQTGVSQRTFLLRGNDCAFCHGDIHRGQLGVDCAKCHTVDQPFSDIDFNHSRTSFPLKGAHTNLSCSKCHADQKWKYGSFSRCHKRQEVQ